MLNTVGMSRIGSRFAALREPGFDTKEPRRPLTRRVRLLGCCRHRGRRLNRARPPLMTQSGHYQINLAVLHNEAARCLLPERQRVTLVAPDDVEQARIRGTKRYGILGTAALVRLNAGELDHLGPLLGFVGDQLSKVGGRARKHRTA